MRRLMDRLEGLSPDELARVYKEVFSTDAGQLVLEDLRNRCFVKLPTAAQNKAVDSHQLALREGMRSVYLHIETQMTGPPLEDLPAMEPETPTT